MWARRWRCRTVIDWSWNEEGHRGSPAGAAHDSPDVSTDDAVAPGTTRHVLAANNMLLGTSNLVVLSLPPRWLLRNGIQRPEVDARRVVGRYCWATLADAHYYLIPPGGPSRADLWVRVRQRAPREIVGPTVAVGGHKGVYQLTESARENRLVIQWSCKKSSRFLELESRGTTPLEPLLQSLQGCQCHSP